MFAVFPESPMVSQWSWPFTIVDCDNFFFAPPHHDDPPKAWSQLSRTLPANPAKCSYGKFNCSFDDLLLLSGGGEGDYWPEFYFVGLYITSTPPSYKTTLVLIYPPRTNEILIPCDSRPEESGPPFGCLFFFLFPVGLKLWRRVEGNWLQSEKLSAWIYHRRFPFPGSLFHHLLLINHTVWSLTFSGREGQQWEGNHLGIGSDCWGFATEHTAWIAHDR